MKIDLICVIGLREHIVVVRCVTAANKCSFLFFFRLLFLSIASAFSSLTCSQPDGWIDFEIALENLSPQIVVLGNAIPSTAGFASVQDITGTWKIKYLQQHWLRNEAPMGSAHCVVFNLDIFSGAAFIITGRKRAFTLARHFHPKWTAFGYMYASVFLPNIFLIARGMCILSELVTSSFVVEQ